MRVLIVDDYGPFRASLKMLLGGECHVDDAGSAAEALCLLQQDAQFDLILVDQQLSAESGLDLCEEVRARHPALHGRMVLMSGGLLDEAQAQQARRAAVPVLGKPFEPAALVPLIGRGHLRELT